MGPAGQAGGGSSGRTTPRGSAPSRGRGELDHLLEGDRSGGHQHHVGAGVVACVVGADGALVQPADAAPGAGDLLTQAVAGIGDPLHQVVGVDVAAARVHLVEDLLQDHLPLHLDLAQQRVADQVGDDVDAGPEPRRVERRVEAGVVAGGHGVHAPARRLDRRVHGAAVRVAAAAAEQQVLDEVADSVRLGLLVARPHPDVERQHGRVEAGRARHHHPGAVGEPGSLPQQKWALRHGRAAPQGIPEPPRSRLRRLHAVHRLLAAGDVRWRRRDAYRESGPRLTSLWHRIVPPCSFTTCKVNARPRPVPPDFVEKNGSKILSSCSAGDARSGVRHRHLGATVRGTGGPDGDRPPAGHGLPAVAEQVEEHRPQLPLVGPDRRESRGEVARHRHPGGGHLRGDEVDEPAGGSRSGPRGPSPGGGAGRSAGTPRRPRSAGPPRG